MWRHHELFLHSCGKCTQRGKGHDERKRERQRHDQPESHSDRRGCLSKKDEDTAWPRCDRELYMFNTASGPVMRCRGWTLAGKPCSLIRACQDKAVDPGRSRSTNHTGGGGSTIGSGGPGTISGQGDGAQDPPPINDWTAQMQALAANPAWAKEQFAQWQLLHQQFQHLQYQQQLAASSTMDPWKVFPRTASPLETSRVRIRERIGLVCTISHKIISENRVAEETVFRINKYRNIRNLLRD